MNYGDFSNRHYLYGSKRAQFAIRMQARVAYAQQQAELGHAHYQYEMAKRYRYGWGVNINIIEAKKLYDLAVKNQHAGACFDLARIYLTGDKDMEIKPSYTLAYAVASAGAKADKQLFAEVPEYAQDDFVEDCTSLLLVIPELCGDNNGGNSVAAELRHPPSPF